MEAVLRFFGRPKASEAAAPKRSSPPTTSGHEDIYRNKASLDELSETYTRLIEERTAKVERFGKMKGMENVTQQHFLRLKKLRKRFEDHTKHVDFIDEVIDLLRRLESSKLTMDSMESAVTTFRDYAKKVNYDKTDDLRAEIEEKQRELSSIQRLLEKPMRGTPVFNDTELKRELAEFLEGSANEEEEEEEEEEDASNTPATATSARAMESLWS